MTVQTPSPNEDGHELDAFLSAVGARSALQHRFLKQAIYLLTATEVQEFITLLRFYRSKKRNTLDYIVTCYLTIVDDTFNEQIYFMKHNSYRYSKFADVANRVYFDADYMHRYMIGLALTAYLWPNHRAIYRFFSERLRQIRGGAYLEVGPGHGYFLITALNNSTFSSVSAVDISATSIQLTREVVAEFEPERSSSLSLIQADFLTADLGVDSYDAVVMGEVLEHVEAPITFLKRLHSLSRPGGFIFVSTCINAPAIDHISLFRSVEEVEQVITDAGLVIKERLYAPYTGRTLEECVKLKLAINVCYELTRQ
jgi:2-polyprenyl-3-methyl-5-hydroxy-6-metoxy-1,4-benzoquinol methylase